MIIVKLQGGLGNQLFQYAAARALAKYHGSSVAFDLTFYQNQTARPGVTARTYGLDVFGVRPVPPPFLDGLALGLWRVPLRRRLQKLLGRWRAIPEYREQSFSYDPAVWQNTTADVHLVGYFQSERYFKDIEDSLRHDLKFLSGADSALLPPGRNLVSLHVRRGDYADNPKVRQVHGLCSLEYYQKAVAYLADRLGEITVVVFSDDQKWAREHLVLPHPVTFVEGHAGRESYRDMQLMSCCHHHVIANSSFSWWGAWLNPSPDKMVVAPDRWLAREKDASESADRIPSGWVRM